MGYKNTHLDNLYTYLENNAQKVKIQSKLEQLEEKLEKLDKQISHFESFGFKETVDSLCKNYNIYNVIRIKLNLKLVELEKALLEFELAAALRN